VDGKPVPLIRPRKAERCDPFTALISEEDKLDLAEHWRLLYVALTRAKERLVIAGVRKKTAVADSWHARVEQAMIAVGAQRDGEDGPLIFESKGDAPRARGRVDRRPAVVLPAWLGEMAPQESRPPRPLAPSGSGQDPTSYPPPKPGEIDAARRGTLLHLLFERLPGVAPEKRIKAAEKWLEFSGGVDEVALRTPYAATVCEIIEHSDFKDIFGENSLAEAPIAAVLPDGRVIAGTVDRLLVGPDTVRVVDFKTGALVPASAAEVPRAHARQMAAYAEALRVIFPGRTVETALLYTSGPKMIALPG
ncbi:MAG: PD-(D/E)XK nuclease family protein, partial [Hyphomicrobium sp.]|nr:PD-(D/E)XK nuclease family protein [Hyphomicrobium sp.]